MIDEESSMEQLKNGWRRISNGEPRTIKGKVGPTKYGYLGMFSQSVVISAGDWKFDRIVVQMPNTARIFRSHHIGHET